MGKSRKQKRAKSPYLHGEDNGRTVLTCGRNAGGLTPTTDPFDRAHLSRDPTGAFYPSGVELPDGTARVNRSIRSTARKYPPSAMTSRGVSHDSMFDEWHKARIALSREGISLGGSGHSASAAAAAVDNRLRDNLRLRDVLEQRTTQAMTAAEAEIEQRADDLLRGAR